MGLTLTGELLRPRTQAIQLGSLWLLSTIFQFLSGLSQKAFSFQCGSFALTVTLILLLFLFLLLLLVHNRQVIVVC